jgi:hypothetical protein
VTNPKDPESKFKDSLIWRSRGMLARVHESRLLMKHQGLYGTENERLLIETLRSYLGSEWAIGTGEIVNVFGEHSPQCDIIIYDPNSMPELFKGDSDNVLVGAHAVGAVLEVKSTIKDGDQFRKKLCKQAADIDMFLTEAIFAGAETVDAKYKSIVANQFRPNDPSHRPMVCGFAYEAVPKTQTLTDQADLFAQDYNLEEMLHIRAGKTVKARGQFFLPPKEQLAFNLCLLQSSKRGLSPMAGRSGKVMIPFDSTKNSITRRGKEQPTVQIEDVGDEALVRLLVDLQQSLKSWPPSGLKRDAWQSMYDCYINPQTRPR